jgi:adenylate kinase family enzyme
MDRVAVIGPAGAGKSTLASEVGLRLGIPVLHLDQLYWRPGWVATPSDEWETFQRQALAAPPWVVDAQHDDMLPDWLEVADTVVFLDASPVRCLWRAARRRLSRGPVEGVPQASPRGRADRSLLNFVRGQWHYRRHLRADLLAGLERRRNGRDVVVLRREEDRQRFFSRVDSVVRARGTF